MKFAKWTFLLSGLYGLLVLTPMLFLEQAISQSTPPAITHPENYYGFLIAALAWQVVFLIISRDPLRYRPLMLVAALLEKLTYVAAMWVLFAQGRLAPLTLGVVSVDGLLGILFIVAYLKTNEAARPAATKIASAI